MPDPSVSAPALPAAGLRLLAIESSTDTLSIALGSGLPGGPEWSYSGPGSAQASIALLPQVRTLLERAAWPLHSLDAVVFARGPGSFTGLRTACAVAQGLAFGAQSAVRPEGLPVLPVDTLLALAHAAVHARQQAGGAPAPFVAALLDARMGELYVAVYASGASGLQALAPPCLCRPQDLRATLSAVLPGGLALHPGGPALLLAGNAFDAYPALAIDIGPSFGAEQQTALPTASALLRLAPGLLAAGGAVQAQDALPLYVRDKVAQTTAEREQQRRAGAAMVSAKG